MSSEKIRLKILLYSLVMSMLLGLVFTIFWFQQTRFLLPTPKPNYHREVSIGSLPDLQKEGIQLEEEISLFHFYNPDCPCSRFNLDHFRDLLRAYDQQVGFYIVLQSPSDEFDEEVASGKLKVLLDEQGKIADLCGVYATPQAVVMNREGSIVYRGNYNRARFCTSKNSWFTQMVLDSELGSQAEVQLSEEALVPYGCNLPSDKETASLHYAGLMNTLKQLIN